MNTLTLKDLPQQDASSGNSFLSMIMMLSMSIGVALAGTLIVFTDYYGTAHVTTAFHVTLICLGCINIITALIFWQIPKIRLCKQLHFLAWFLARESRYDVNFILILSFA